MYTIYVYQQGPLRTFCQPCWKIMQESYSMENVFVYLVIYLFTYDTWAELLTVLSPGRFVVEVGLFPSTSSLPLR